MSTTPTAKGYDYIVVGAGSAGCTLASRLSENPAISVLLLEAGDPPRGMFRDMPAATKQTMEIKALDWGLHSDAEPGLNGRHLHLRRGKTVGGCSQINGMIYSRGHPADYDEWAALGCDGWSYRDVLPFFRRSENSWAGASQARGGLGPLGVTRIASDAPLVQELREATRQAGFAGSPDYHSDYAEGFVPLELTVARGRRANTGTAYLRPALKRGNLKLITGAQIMRVDIGGGRARGIEYVSQGQRRHVSVDREIILSSGAYGSPQILMQSGIGDPEDLKRVGIAVSQDRAEVGKNLIEHPMLYMNFRARGRTFMDELRFDRAVLSVLRWRLFGTGPFTTNACAGNIFVRSEPALDKPDIQLVGAAVSLGSKLWAPWDRKRGNGLSLGVIALRQSSRGSVTLRSDDPLDQPSIRLNLLTEPDDMQRMIAGVRLARRIYAQPALAEMVEAEELPGASTQSDEELAAYTRQFCQTAHHPVGTCRMGTDANAVVDPRLRVNGVDGLRVADASIMPTIVSGNTNVPAIMIGEKAADLILDVEL